MTHLHEAAHHMVSEHGQTGSALAEHVDSVDRHDDGLRPRIVCHQDTDPAVAEANRVVCHPEELKTPSIVCAIRSEARGHRSWSYLRPCCSSRWTWHARLMGSGRIRTITISKVTST